MWRNLRESSWRDEDRRPIWEWAFDSLRLRESPYGKRFVIDETPWLKEPLEVMPDNSTREVVLMCCAQGGKTISMSVAACWALVHQPAPMMVVAQTDEAAKRFSRQRLIPMIESCADLRDSLPRDRHEKTIREILFTNSTLMVGPANDTFLRAHSIRWLFCDEVSDWRAGLVEQARARTTRFWNRRHWIASTPLDEGSDLDRAYLSGDQREWHLRCIHCKGMIPLEFKKVIRWDTNETTKPEGVWNYGEMRKTVRLECPSCKKAIRGTDQNVRTMNEGGGYVAKNPKVGRTVASFRFNALCLPPSMLSWADLAEQFLRAKAEASRGYLAPMKEFTTLRLAESWSELQANQPKPIKLDDYKPEGAWENEKVRFLTVDCQHNLEDFWAVVRAWDDKGASRLVDFQRLKSFDEVEELRVKHEVKEHLTFLDVGYERHRVLSECGRRGWAGMAGDDAVSFLHTQLGHKLRLPFAPASMNDCRDGSGKRVPVFRWSNPTVKDLLANMRNKRGADWQVADVGHYFPAYIQQMDSERKKQTFDRLGRPILKWVRFRENHAWDCECMSVSAACIAGILANPEAAPTSKGTDRGD